MSSDTQTNMDVFHEETIDDYWIMDGDTSLFETWIGDDIRITQQIHQKDMRGFKAE